MTKEKYKSKDLPFTGKLITSTDPMGIGNNFRTLTNMKYTDTNPKTIGGMTKINTSASPRPTIKSGFHFTKDQPQESHVLIQAQTSTTNSNVYKNDTAIPSAGAFDPVSILTETASTVQTGRFSKAPNGNMIYCNGDGSYRWGGDELRIGSFISYDPDGSFWYDYSDRVRNTKTDASNLATVNVTSGGGNSSAESCDVLGRRCRRAN